MPFLFVVLALIVVGCGGSRPGSVSPDAGPTAAVNQFMRAVADSNLPRMSELWGTSRGSAAATRQPADYERRIQIMHAYLKGTEAKVLGAIERADDRVVYQVELARADCRRNVPFTVVRVREEVWVVNAIDLAAAGTPGRPCASEDRRPPGR